MKKAPFESPKNFLATGAGDWVSAPKVARQLFSPTAGGFEKTPLKSPKNFLATATGMSVERTQSNVSAF